MFVEESIWIKKQLAVLDLPKESCVLDIGSSSKDIRCRIQSHIDTNVFAPLLEREMRIRHLDRRTEEGVDFVVDIEDSDMRDKIPDVFDLVICTNLLEHVRDVSTTVKNIVSFVAQGGYLLITAPYRYPRHKDPIDTLFRPSDKVLQELISRYAKFKVVCSQILDIRDPAYYFYESVIPFYGYRRAWRFFLKALRWKVSCVVAQRCDPGDENERA